MLRGLMSDALASVPIAGNPLKRINVVHSAPAERDEASHSPIEPSADRSDSIALQPSGSSVGAAAASPGRDGGAESLDNVVPPAQRARSKAGSA
jgi:hypothetical protein